MVLAPTVYAVVLAAAFAAAQLPLPAASELDGAAAKRPPVATVTALIVVAVPTLAQLTVAPWLLGALQRNWAAISTGQMWRLVTSLVVQDSGLPGAAFNLTSLAVIGSAAEAAWGPRRWTAVALTSGIGAQLWGWVVQPRGAGNSVAVFGLAASLAVLALWSGTAGQRLLGSVSLLAAAVLILVGDLHGGAAAIGAVTATVLQLRRVRQPQ